MLNLEVQFRTKPHNFHTPHQKLSSLGIDQGFDVSPRLSKSIEDRLRWNAFLDVIRIHYHDDEVVENKSNYLVFKAGEHPRLPFEGHKLLRFSSKVSGSCYNVEEYIVTNDARDQYGIYSWSEVHESEKLYEKPDELDHPASAASPVLGMEDCIEADSALCEIRQVPGKGRGLIARVDIPKGTRILVEDPLLKTPNMSEAMRQAMVAPKLRALSKEQQRHLLSLHNNFPGKNAFSGIVKINALPCGVGATVGYVYATISLINHSCRPKPPLEFRETARDYIRHNQHRLRRRDYYQLHSD